MSFQEYALEVLILALCVVISYVVEKFALLLKDLILKSTGEQVVLGIIEDVHLRIRLDLELVEKVILGAWLLLEFI